MIKDDYERKYEHIRKLLEEVATYSEPEDELLDVGEEDASEVKEKYTESGQELDPDEEETTLREQYFHSEIAMSFPTKDDRQKCWDSRDRYWECLDQHPQGQEKCQKLRQAYESSCPAQWVKHFDRKREYLKFKARIEKEGYDPLNER